ncbi:hypothetical protein [Roseibacillus persicicus]|uniref:hypothetical protein n=1 Tax=Roseibacillus persicicus TaxID=454148 RepID=UPI00167191B1|nr:hypothetical protein [Roseibacillus persicicus]
MEESEFDFIGDLDAWRAIHSIDPESSVNVLVDKIGKLGDLSLLQTALSELPDWFENDSYGFSLGQTWPFERREELLAALPPEHWHAVILPLVSNTDPEVGLDWLLSVFRAQTTPQMVRGNLVARMDWVGEMIQNSNRSPEERAALRAEFEGESSSSMGKIVAGDVSRFLRGEEDRFYQFHTGNVGASALLDELLKHRSSLEGHEDEVRSKVFAHLAETNLHLALELYENDSLETVDDQKLRAAREAFHGVNPEKFLQLMQSVGPGNEEMLEVWKGKTESNLERYGEDYLSWLRSLPEEPQKWLALEAVVEMGQERYPELVEDAQLQIQNR